MWFDNTVCMFLCYPDIYLWKQVIIFMPMENNFKKLEII